MDQSDRTPEIAACRELKEEVGLIGKRFRKLGDTTFGEYHIQFFVCDQWAGRPKASCSDIVRVGWFSLAEMHAVNPGLAPFVSNSIMYIAYLMQHYRHFPNEWLDTWREVDGNGQNGYPENH